MKLRCECEHISHFPEDEHVTPDGNLGHAYGHEFRPGLMRVAQTQFGMFTVCKWCYADCHGRKNLVER